VNQYKETTPIIDRINKKYYCFKLASTINSSETLIVKHSMGVTVEGQKRKHSRFGEILLTDSKIGWRRRKN
jgi:hypothetical protein